MSTTKFVSYLCNFSGGACHRGWTLSGLNVEVKMLNIVRHIDHLVTGEAGVILRPPIGGIHPGVSHGHREGLSELPMVTQGQEKNICLSYFNGDIKMLKTV